MAADPADVSQLQALHGFYLDACDQLERGEHHALIDTLRCLARHADELAKRAQHHLTKDATQ